MADTELLSELAEAIVAEAIANPPRDEWKDREGFNIVSLGAWLDVCKAAGVDAVPATEIGKIEIETLMIALDLRPDSTEENDATRALRAFWTKIDAAKQPNTHDPLGLLRMRRSEIPPRHRPARVAPGSARLLLHRRLPRNRPDLRISRHRHCGMVETVDAGAHRRRLPG